MSSRERWIVYPLLFLTLGLTMRPKIGEAPDHDRTYFGDIQCRTINGQAPVFAHNSTPQRPQPRMRIVVPQPITPPEESPN